MSHTISGQIVISFSKNVDLFFDVCTENEVTVNQMNRLCGIFKKRFFVELEGEMENIDKVIESLERKLL